MVITSENKKNGLITYKSTQFRYAAVYVIVTFVVLLFLNIYSSKISQALFYNSKKSAMIERCLMVASEVKDLEILNKSNVAGVVDQLDIQSSTRVVITDESCAILFDSENAQTGTYALFPEILQAMPGYNVFSWNYQNNTMASCAATPIYSYDVLIGSVYMMDYDTEQGALIATLQKNILIISVILELTVIAFSLIFSSHYSRRLKKITSSIGIIREGDYSHKVNMGGSDELSVLGHEFDGLIDRLRTSEKKRSQFVSDASHELKTPLASIKLLTDSILQNDVDPDTIREFVGDIGNEADRLTRMSQKLLTLSKIDTQTDNTCEIVYMEPTVRKVVRMLSALAEKQGVTIHTDLSDDSPVLVLEDDLYQIIFNLVENGIKYNVPEGSLSIRLHRDNDNTVLEVSDTGAGIPEDSLEHIFERFYRVDKARSRKSGGSGLGLSIVRNIVERNRGSIQVESTLGKGTTFTLTFPAFDTEVDK